MAVIGPLFYLQKKREACQEASRLRPLPPSARQDLVLLAALSPIMVTNVSAPFSSTVSCSDASTARGATCVAPLPPLLSAHL